MFGLPLSEILALLVAVVAAGLIGGLIAGLFGVGGGTVIVPALFYAFEVLGLGGEANLHVAIGTSLMTIVATSWRSLGAHRSHGAVDEVVLKTWTPWVGIGALIGAAVAGFTSMEGLAIVYGVCLLVIAAQMGLMPERFTLARDVPTGWTPARCRDRDRPVVGHDGHRGRQFRRHDADPVRAADPSGGGDGFGVRRGHRSGGDAGVRGFRLGARRVVRPCRSDTSMCRRRS